MDLKFEVNTGRISFNDTISPRLAKQLQHAVNTSLNLIKSTWIQEAQKTLKSTSNIYINGISPNSSIHPVVGSGFSGWVGLTQKFPQMLESGFPAFDMKPGFSKGRKTKVSKTGGWYTTIPFFYGKPKNNQNLPQLPKAVNQQAKKLRLGETLIVPGAGEKAWNGYQHKNSEYSGLTRIVNSYHNKPSGALYSTFRRVSNNSDPSSWNHPGFQGAHILEKIKPKLKPLITAIFKESFSQH